MSQSIGNYIGVAEDPKEILGKVMSLPDEAMPAYVRLALDLRPDDKDTMIAEAGGVVLKRLLAREMIAMFHGAETAADAEAEFDRVFVRRDVPSKWSTTRPRRTTFRESWSISVSRHP